MFLDTKRFYYQYDMDSTSYKYGRLGDNHGFAVQGGLYAKTSGASTTVTAVSGTPFDPMNAGDVIVFYVTPGVGTIRKVATKVSGSEITIDSAITIAAAGCHFDFYPFKIGTTTADGWHHTQMYSGMTLNVNVATVAAAGGISMSVEIVGAGGLMVTPIVVLERSYTAAGTEAIVIEPQARALRVGLKGNTGFAGTDVVSISLTGEMRR